MQRRSRGRNNNKINNKNKKVILMTVIGLLVFLLFISVIFAIINIGNDKIALGVKIGNIDVSNLTQEEATNKVKEWYNEILENGINIKYEKMEENINIEEFDASLDIDKLIKQARNIGKSENIIKNNYDILFAMLFSKKIDLQIDLSQEKINEKIKQIDSELPNALEESNYYIEDENLIIAKGKNGIKIDEEKFNKDLRKIITRDSGRVIELSVLDMSPKEINIRDIQKEIYKEPQDAIIEKQPLKVIPEVYGIDIAISLEEAENILSESKDEYIIPLKITVPDITLSELGKEAFPQVLATFSTTYSTNNENRETNLKLASEKINGTIILPGETFSYNKIVGERTISKGYKEAAVYSGGKVVNGIGGGICQLSSTLYNTAIYANLEVTKRSNHRFLTSYVTAGRDATVSYGTLDFCFKNTRNYPIKIVSSVKNGVVTTEILGIKEEKEYDVEILAIVKETVPFETKYVNDSKLDEGKEEIKQYGANGAKSVTYKILRENGVIISQEVLSEDTYSPLERIVKKGTKRTEGASARIFADSQEDKTEQINPELLETIKEL